MKTESLDIISDYNSFEGFVHERYTTSASIRTMLAGVEVEQAEIWHQVEEAVDTYTDAD